MLTVRSVFLIFLSLPGSSVAGLPIGLFIGGGSLGLQLALRWKHVEQVVWSQDIPGHIARSMTVAFCANSILLVMGVLAFVGLLAGYVSVTGMVLTSWTVVFVTTCGLATLSGYMTVFIARKRHVKALRLHGIVPKEAREGEQGTTER